MSLSQRFTVYDTVSCFSHFCIFGIGKINDRENVGGNRWLLLGFYIEGEGGEAGGGWGWEWRREDDRRRGEEDG